jgi:hypothetical protein
LQQIYRRKIVVIPNTRTYRRQFLAGTVCLLIAAQTVLAGQSNVGIRVQITQGNNAQNVLEQIPATPITIRVIDRSNRPVQGATVVFTTPEQGPSGDFANGLNTLRTITNENGIAVAPEYRPNEIPGPYRIRVQVDYLGETLTALIRQTNLSPKKSFSKLIVILAVAGAAGAAGTALAGRSSKSTTNPSTPSTPGSTGGSIPTITFGGSSVTGGN